MENTWLFPLLEAIHVVGLALLVGTIVLADLTVLGWIPRPVASLAPWTRAGLAIAFATGLALFLGDTARYLDNAAFLSKMALLGAALAAHFTVHRRATRATAALSLALWTLVVLTARAVIDFDV